MREQGRSKTGTASLPHVTLAPMSAPGSTVERHEHLDAIFSFAAARQRRRLFRRLDTFTIRWATGDLLVECRFLLNTQPTFLKNEKDPTLKQFDDDDDEWIRSLTEAQEITADVPKDIRRPDKGSIVNVLVAQVWDFIPVVGQFAIKDACAASPRAAAAQGEATHTSRAALRPGAAAVVKRSAGEDCASVSPLGSVVIPGSASSNPTKTA